MRASIKIGGFAFAILSAIVVVAFQANAFNASSTDFYVRQDVLSGAGDAHNTAFSTSSDFKTVAATGQTATGTSTATDFGLLGGFLRNLYKGPAPTYEVIHYHWRNDNNGETNATSATGGSQDTAITSVAKGSSVRLRVEVANHGGTVLGYLSQRFGLQYGIQSSTCAAITSWVNVGSSTASTASADWTIGTTTNLTSGANTTNIAVSTGGVSDANYAFLTPNGGVVNNIATNTAAVLLPSDSFIELEYSLSATTTATAGATYCFRAVNASSTTNFLYTVYPQATVAGGASLSATIDGASETFPNLTPGFLVATSSILSVTTTNASGFNVTVSRQNSSATMLLSGSPSVSITDNTAWAPGGNCAANGDNSIASTTNPNTLQFRVKQAGTDSSNYCSNWWGTDDTTANARFAGFPTTAQQIINRSSASSPATNAIILYNLNVSALQQTGTYSGTITYTITANP